MNDYPEYIEVNGKKYKINTDFRFAIECNRIAEDDTINDFERALGIIETLFGDEAIDDGKNNIDIYSSFMKIARKYLCCGKELENNENNEEPDMDFIEDMDYIEASFMSDYHIDLAETKMHWWKFYNLINGLSNSEMGNCCVLNRIRNLRTYDTKDIKDKKELEKIMKAKEQVALKKNKKQNNLTEEQEKSIQKLNEILGI